MFPALKPTARSWVDGQLPMQSFIGMAGTETRIVTGNTLVGQRLSLAFDNLLETDALLVSRHYQGQRGGFLSFDLPAEVFAGWTDYSQSKPSGSRWRYDAAPSVASVAPGIMSVSVELVAVAE